MDIAYSDLTPFLFIFGAIVGSFLTVCIYRIPLSRLEDWQEDTKDITGDQDIAQDLEVNTKEAVERSKIGIMKPARSFCPHCNKQLRWWHNIPILSWVILHGKCAFCSAKISFRYPLVELLSAILATLSFQHFGVSLTGLVVFIFCAALLVISFIDYDYYIIPNVISLPGIVIGVGIAGINQFTHLFHLPIVPGIKDSLLGILCGAGILLFVSEVYLRLRKKEGLGMGDVKLLGMTGALFGFEASFYTILIGSLLGSIIGVFLIVFFRRKMSHPLPFGPYLAFATILYLFAGNQFIDNSMRSVVQIF